MFSHVKIQYICCRNVLFGNIERVIKRKRETEREKEIVTPSQHESWLKVTLFMHMFPSDNFHSSICSVRAFLVNTKKLQKYFVIWKFTLSLARFVHLRKNVPKQNKPIWKHAALFLVDWTLMTDGCELDISIEMFFHDICAKSKWYWYLRSGFSKVCFSFY